jgi:cytochrome c-type biogenesis protein CcmH
MRNGVYVLAAAAIMLAAAAPDPVRQIEERFLAPCCWRESVAVHQSPKAEELRAEIRQMVAAKKSEAEIVDHYVARYGERILREPRGLRSLWLMIVPLAALFVGGTALTVYLRHASRAAPVDS